jgi:hypothetical protein
MGQVDPTCPAGWSQYDPVPLSRLGPRRLPGVATFDDRGETENALLRGLVPGLTVVTLDGEQLPTTGLRNREVSLSAMPAEMLSSMLRFNFRRNDRAIIPSRTSTGSHRRTAPTWLQAVKTAAAWRPSVVR